MLVTSGKEHLQWWKIYAESRTLQPVAKPQYDVSIRVIFAVYLTFRFTPFVAIGTQPLWRYYNSVEQEVS